MADLFEIELEMALRNRNRKELANFFKRRTGDLTLSADECKQVADIIENGVKGTHGRPKERDAAHDVALMTHYGIFYLAKVGIDKIGYPNKSAAKKAFCSEVLKTSCWENNGTFIRLHREWGHVAQRAAENCKELWMAEAEKDLSIE